MVEGLFVSLDLSLLYFSCFDKIMGLSICIDFSDNTVF